MQQSRTQCNRATPYHDQSRPPTSQPSPIIFEKALEETKHPDLKTNMTLRCRSTIQKKPASHAFLHVVCLFSFGCPPISFQYCFTISFAFAILSSGSQVLSFSSQPSHFTSYSQHVPSEHRWWFAMDWTTQHVAGWLVRTGGGGGRQAILESSVRSTLSLLTLSVSCMVMSFGRSSSTVYPRI